MSPVDVARSWHKSKPVLYKVGSWMCLVQIAAAGERGTNLHELANRGLGPVVDLPTLNKWIAAGLIERRESPVSAVSRNHRRTRRYVATEKAYRLLRLTPPLGAPICNRPQPQAQSATSQPSTKPTP